MNNNLYCQLKYSFSNIFSASVHVSEETAHIILKEFLDTGKTEFDTDFSAVYEQEIAKRNY